VRLRVTTKMPSIRSGIAVAALVGAMGTACFPRHVVQPGERVRIRTAGDENRIEGRLMSAGPDSLRVETEGGSIALARGDARGISYERIQPMWERVRDGVLAGAYATLAGYEIARDDGSRGAERVLMVGLFSAMAIQFGYGASHEKEWRPAKLPEAR
jgi:hypothetical protein